MSPFQRLFGKKKPASSPQKTGAVQSQKAGAKEQSTKSQEEHDPPKFAKASTTHPEQAVDILFAKAMAVVPVLSATQFGTAYHRMREAWGPLPLVEGSESEVKSVILHNAKALARMADFKRFSIDVCLSDQGYKGEEAAQMWAWVGAGALAVHLWKTEDTFHAYGRPELLAETPSLKT
jgi:hypothetical protein